MFLAKPVLAEGKIVVPIFDTKKFRGGLRASERGDRSQPIHDKLAFFNAQTGLLETTVDLKTQFEGHHLAVSKDMIMIGLSSRPSNFNFDASLIFDRKQGNKLFYPGATGIDKPLDTMTKGTVELSPSQPYFSMRPLTFSSSEKDRIMIWKLDSAAGTVEVVAGFPATTIVEGQRAKLEKITWHRTAPTVAWIDGKTVKFYNAELEKLQTNDWVADVHDVVDLSNGWLIIGWQRMVELDLELKVRNNYLTTQRMTGGPFPDPADFEGTFDQRISPAGEVFNRTLNSNLRLIQLRENRIETLPVE